MEKFGVALLLLAAAAPRASDGLRYNYGDGSYYEGEVDGQGRPSGRGRFFNTTGALGEAKTRKEELSDRGFGTGERVAGGIKKNFLLRRRILTRRPADRLIARDGGMA